MNGRQGRNQQATPPPRGIRRDGAARRAFLRGRSPLLVVVLLVATGVWGVAGAQAAEGVPSLQFEIATGPLAGDFPAEEFGWSTPIGVRFGQGSVAAAPVFGGDGCDGATVPASDVFAWPGEGRAVVFSGDGCSSSHKVEAGQLAGYNLVLIASTHAASDGGASPDALACGPKEHAFLAQVSAVCIGHRAMHLIFGDDPPSYSGSDDAIHVGARGEAVHAVPDTDGDGRLDPVDNCRLLATADESDSDGDGLGDACDPRTAISYRFSGFFAPVANPPQDNVATAGAAIPIKFSLAGYQGLDVLAKDSPRSREVPCDSDSSHSDVDVGEASGSSRLTYDAGSDQYVYVWKTDKAWKGSCRAFELILRDGARHSANFRFSR